MKDKTSHTVESNPTNVSWGVFDPHKDPVLKVASGTTVEIETVTPPRENHRAMLTDAGVDEDEILSDEITVAEEVPYTGPGPHVVTGPVAIEGAEPGDVLEVQINDIELRAPYGVNLFLPDAGELPKQFPYKQTEVVPLDMDAGVARFNDDVQIPLAPFLGIMGVSPTPSQGETGTLVPGHFGGNLDLQHLRPGATLYLPVQAEDALFWAGDGHAVQGNGEVCLTAVETSITATLKFKLHKTTDRTKWPMAETDDYYIVWGLDESLDNGLKHALTRCIEFLNSQRELSEADAYRLASLAVDFNVTQVVNGKKGVHAMIPKSIFREGGDVDPSQLD